MTVTATCTGAPIPWPWRTGKLVDSSTWRPWDLPERLGCGIGHGRYKAGYNCRNNRSGGDGFRPAVEQKREIPGNRHGPVGPAASPRRHPGRYGGRYIGKNWKYWEMPC